MALLQPKSHSLPHSEERRRHQRVRVNLQGRYMLADRSEFPCQVVNISPGGIALIAPVSGAVGDRVIAYVDHLGRLEGKIARQLQNGFAMTIAATPRKRDMLAAQLTWLANRSLLNLPEDRRHGRFVPKITDARLILPNGTNVGVRLLDLSLSGAGIGTPARPEIGSHVTIGKIPGRVVRHLEQGFAIEFQRMQHPDSVEENATAQSATE
jgi:PilZ domain